jgi:hypothetical protein
MPTALLCAATAQPAFATHGSIAAKHRRVVCQRQTGHTILRRGPVRLFKRSGAVYGCLMGHRSTWQLWASSGDPFEAMSGSVSQVAGRYVAFASRASNQYTYGRAVEVEDLGSGASYTIAEINEEMNIHVTGEPPTPGPWPLEAFRLGPDGRTARLYATYTPPTAGLAERSASPSGQVLDLIGFNGSRQQLATSGPGEIAPSSLAYDGQTVRWTRAGAAESAGV